eukprot:CAMPEP_0181357772 /NCGR_PEP_ID=MMETSP1106-20121128/5147_1 /TAXON_ID=81844 /ORGANISM="Mantoniella antarctica, Strain SL-175" /LENGTH=110 /DNA_ID=CAMNT_0023470673 /DNA_START=231 /DNA_END=560 /DNA_ORIENTATION=+
MSVTDASHKPPTITGAVPYRGAAAAETKGSGACRMVARGLLLVDVREAALAAVVAVEVVGHEDAGAALGRGALLAQARHLAGVVHLVQLEERQLHLLVLVADLLGLGVRL